MQTSANQAGSTSVSHLLILSNSYYIKGDPPTFTTVELLSNHFPPLFRSRFLPVKKSSDLLLIMSNLYNLHKGTLKMSPERMFQSTPLVKLGDQHFKKVKKISIRSSFSFAQPNEQFENMQFLHNFSSRPGCIKIRKLFNALEKIF